MFRTQGFIFRKTVVYKSVVQSVLHVLFKLYTCILYGQPFKVNATPVQTYYRPRGFQEAETPRFRDNLDMKLIRLCALGTGTR
jgi:hypothetical protein